jgi:hypothetical protein
MPTRKNLEPLRMHGGRRPTEEAILCWLRNAQGGLATSSELARIAAKPVRQVLAVLHEMRAAGQVALHGQRWGVA